MCCPATLMDLGRPWQTIIGGREVASFPGHSHLHFLIACSMQKWRGKAWKRKSHLNLQNNELYWHCLSNITVSSFWTRYRIVENFWGKKPPQILQFYGYPQKFSPRNWGAWCPLAQQKRAICESFLHENRIFCQFAKVFSLESFPLYSITRRSLRFLVHIQTYRATPEPSFPVHDT